MLNRLTVAKRDETAKSNLATTTNRLNNLLNTQDLTPTRNVFFDNAIRIKQLNCAIQTQVLLYKSLQKRLKQTCNSLLWRDALPKATIANTVAQRRLLDATTAHNNVVDKLNSIKDAIKRTKAIKDLTPAIS